MSIVDNRDGLLEAGPSGRTNAAPCKARVLETRTGGRALARWRII